MCRDWIAAGSWASSWQPNRRSQTDGVGAFVRRVAVDVAKEGLEAPWLLRTETSRRMRRQLGLSASCKLVSSRSSAGGRNRNAQKADVGRVDVMSITFSRSYRQIPSGRAGRPLPLLHVSAQRDYVQDKCVCARVNAGRDIYTTKQKLRSFSRRDSPHLLSNSSPKQFPQSIQLSRQCLRAVQWMDGVCRSAVNKPCSQQIDANGITESVAVSAPGIIEVNRTKRHASPEQSKAVT
jgi:hypothetical protein